MRTLLAAALTLLTIATQAALGELIVNGDMSTNTYATGGNHCLFQDLDQGWAVKRQANLDLNTNPGMMTWDGPMLASSCTAWPRPAR